MKSLTFSLAAGLMLMVLSTTWAAPPSSSPGNMLIRSTPIEKMVLRLTIANLEKQPTTIKIQSLDGRRTYFNDFVRDHNGYAKEIDLENLGKGKYTLRVSQSDESYIQVIVIDDGRMRLSQVR